MSERGDDRDRVGEGGPEARGAGGPLARRVAQRHERFAQQRDLATATCRCVTISREPGARGGTIGQAVATKLDWQFYDQEVLEYLANEPADRARLLDVLDGPTASWAGDWLAVVLQTPTIDADSAVVRMAQVVLAVGMAGQAVIVGRGANYVLPRNRALSVRVVAPLSERVAYLVHRERVSQKEAEKRVHDREAARSSFAHTYFHRDIASPHDYDLTIDSSALGEDVSADLVVQALEAKVARLLDRLRPGRPR